MEKILVTVDEAAELLSVSTRTLWSLTKSKKVPHVRIGRSVRYHLDELRSWFAGLAIDAKQVALS